jgi:transposase-like protein
VVRYGRQAHGEPRERCPQVAGERRLCPGRYPHTGRVPEVKRQGVDRALNGSGIREAARVLGVSPTTVSPARKTKRRRVSR